MALAKAFPDAFMYELHEPSSVSYSFIIFRELFTPQYAACYCNIVTLKLCFSFSDFRLPLSSTSLCTTVSSTVPPLLPSPQWGRGQWWRRTLWRGPGGGERSGEHPPALCSAIQKQVYCSQCHQWKQRQWQKLRHTCTCIEYMPNFTREAVFRVMAMSSVHSETS